MQKCVNIVTEVTQLEDPRLEWLSIQEAMLREYLHTAQEALEVSINTEMVVLVITIRMAIAMIKLHDIHYIITNA